MIMHWSLIVFVSSIVQLISGWQEFQYPEQYNLIDAYPSCKHSVASLNATGYDLCDCGNTTYGHLDNIYPSPWERKRYLMLNMARHWPEEFLATPYTEGLADEYPSEYGPGCGVKREQIKPFYWLSQANQVCRWHQCGFFFCACPDLLVGEAGRAGECGTLEEYPIEWSCQPASDNIHCDNVGTGHATCADYCRNLILAGSSFGHCDGYKNRVWNFVQLQLEGFPNIVTVGGEGVWPSGLTTLSGGGHCGVPFNEGYELMGIGKYPGRESMTIFGLTDGRSSELHEDYPIPHAAHFQDGDTITFIVQFFGGNKTPPLAAGRVVLLLGGSSYDMAIYENNAGQRLSTEDQAAAFFIKQIPLSEFGSEWPCKAYSFLVQAVPDESGDEQADAVEYVLPENENYLFATYGPELESAIGCGANHYYYNAGDDDMCVNGAPETLPALLDNTIVRCQSRGVEPTSVTCPGCDSAFELFELRETLRAAAAGPVSFPTPPPTFPTESPTVDPATCVLFTAASVTPSAGQQLVEIPILDEMRFEFDITVNSIPTQWTSVFRCGSLEDVRLPAVFLHPDADDEGAAYDGFFVWVLDAQDSTGPALVPGQSYHFLLELTQSSLVITIDGIIRYGNYAMAAHSTYASEPCYMSSPFEDWYTKAMYPAADVRIDNFVISSTSSVAACSTQTLSPTTTGPTQEPTTADPTVQPTPHPTPQPVTSELGCPYLSIVEAPATESHVLGYVRIPASFHVEFDSTFYSWPDYDKWRSIFSCGATTTQRLPGVYIHSSAGGSRYPGFYVILSTPDNSDAGQATGTQLVLEQNYHFELDVIADVLTVTVDGVEKISRTGHVNHTTENEVPCYFDSPWETGADATVTNLVFSTPGSACPTSAPTTAEPTTTTDEATTTVQLTTEQNENDEEDTSVNGANSRGLSSGGLTAVLLACISLLIFSV
eukprot:CAMPEP_0202725084 /NCGR_PEP_ID=MMETSP1385-20130828/179195_1 /ASSEMBLY_ACC=CAM_ASM_000861 /TAXON_ID=933848 /ORGANISM="Elphidium margaritaceum" /LENGTH=940 /DNA_ID=CAMNT_0049390981 /DNA_START=48 /DNA_END=2870 /DNA_ORIENTATION=+